MTHGSVGRHLREQVNDSLIQIIQLLANDTDLLPKPGEPRSGVAKLTFDRCRLLGRLRYTGSRVWLDPDSTLTSKDAHCFADCVRCYAQTDSKVAVARKLLSYSVPPCGDLPSDVISDLYSTAPSCAPVLIHHPSRLPVP